MTDLPNGTSARVHADFSMQHIEQIVAEFDAIRALKRNRKTGLISKRDRGLYGQRLAGMVGHAEALRLYVVAGAPE